MTTIVFDTMTKTLYADTQAEYSIVNNATRWEKKFKSFDNLKLFRTSQFIAGGAGDYHAVVSIIAHLVGHNRKIQDVLPLRGPATWGDSQVVVATNELVMLFECTTFFPLLFKNYAVWKRTDIRNYSTTHRWICLGSGDEAFHEGITETDDNIIEAYRYVMKRDSHTGGRLISTSLEDNQLLVDHGLIDPSKFFL